MAWRLSWHRAWRPGYHDGAAVRAPRPGHAHLRLHWASGSCVHLAQQSALLRLSMYACAQAPMSIAARPPLRHGFLLRTPDPARNDSALTLESGALSKLEL